MDMSLVSAIMAQQAAATQQQVATAVTKQNLDSEKSSVLTLLGSAQQSLSLANVGDRIGGNLYEKAASIKAPVPRWPALVPQTQRSA